MLCTLQVLVIIGTFLPVALIVFVTNNALLKCKDTNSVFLTQKFVWLRDFSSTDLK